MADPSGRDRARSFVVAPNNATEPRTLAFLRPDIELVVAVCLFPAWIVAVSEKYAESGSSVAQKTGNNTTGIGSG